MFRIFKRRRKTGSRSIGHQLGIEMALERRDVPSTAALVGGILMVNGTSGNDAIAVSANDGGNVIVRDGGQNIAKFAPGSVHQIQIRGFAGNDKITVSENLKIPTIIQGGQGNDVLQAGSGPSILIGGGGNDTLIGGANRDILIGGDGADTLYGNFGDDVLVAGRSKADDNPNAWEPMLKIWNSPATYAERIQQMEDGGGAFVGFRAETIAYDNSIDTLTGGDSMDWFMAGPTTRIMDLSRGEKTN